MKLKAIGTVQVADAKGKVTEHKPGTVFNVSNVEGERLIEARHAEAVGKDEEAASAAPSTPATPPAGGTDAGTGTPPAP
jgi:hypothetical protein